MGRRNDANDAPIIQPRIIRKLKNRRRLVDMGFREEFLEELDEVVCEFRRPENVAERGVGTVGERTRRASARVVRRVLETGNETVFRNL